MFKYLGLLLLTSLTAVPAAANSFDATQIQSVRRDGEEETETYTYVEDQEGCTRVYDSRELGPEIHTHFCAPKGYVYSTTISTEKLDAIVAEFDAAGAAFDWTDIIFNYGIYGTEVYQISQPFWYPESGSGEKEDQIAWFKQTIKNYVDGHEFLSVEEVIAPATLFVRLDIQATIYDADLDWDREWTFSFYSENVEIEPYNEFDFVQYRVRYFQHENIERRVNIDAELIPDFFNEYSTNNEYAYNPHGWLTDTTTVYEHALEPRPDGSDHYWCDYKLTLVAFDTVTIGYFDRSFGLEMTYPDEPIRAKIQLEFTSGGVDYTFCSREFIFGDPNLRMAVDYPTNRKSVQKDTEHTYSIQFDHLDGFTFQTFDIKVDGEIDRLMPDDEYVIYCYDYESENEIPTPSEGGKEGAYYYIPSANEKELHNQGRDEEMFATPSEGKYYVWDKYYDGYDPDTYEPIYSYHYAETDLVTLIDVTRPGGYEDEETHEWIYVDPISDEELDSLTNLKLSFPFTGRFSSFAFNLHAEFTDGSYAYITNEQAEPFEIVERIETDNKIVLDVDDDVHLIDGGNDIVITPKVDPYDENIPYYYGYSLDKEGIVEVSQELDGKLNVHPLKAGAVKLTIKVDSTEFSEITKTITIRVLDGILDNATIEVAKGFHKAGVNLEASLAVRGFANLQNANVTWKVVDKKGNEIPEERVIANKNASMTLINPDSDDYTITAYYEDIEIATLTVQVRYVDMDKFLRANIWWIVLITLSFVFLMVFFATVTKRSKSTVDRIERVYGVYCQCISNDSLSKEELVRIKREITRCLHHCEDLNIDAFNQYEKATRYLRKSLGDVKSLMKNYDALTEGEKSVMYERLNADLGKALNVAKEIENAKGLIEQYHSKANKQNYEVLKEDKPNKKEK